MLTSAEIQRRRRKHYRGRIRKAGYFNAGARRYRRSFVAREHREMGDVEPRYLELCHDMEYRRNLMRYLYAWPDGLLRDTDQPVEGWWK